MLSHPQAAAQCARFLREQLPGAEVRAVAEHRRGGARRSASRERPGRRSAPRSAAELYGCVVLREGVEDERRQRHPLRLARARAGPSPAATAPGRPRWSSPSSARTTPAPWSRRCASSPPASVNLTRIESRPLRRGLGRYMFFSTSRARRRDAAVAEAIEGLRDKAESVRVLGCYPVQRAGSLASAPVAAGKRLWLRFAATRAAEAGSVHGSTQRRRRAAQGRGSSSSTRPTSRSTSARCAAPRCCC